MLSKLWK